MKYCRECLLPDTHETITFDTKGICNICSQHKYKNEKMNWAEREVHFNQLLEEYRGKFTYDCIVPFSGGKDSVFTLLTLKKKFKLKCLVVSFDHGFFRPGLIENRKKVFQKLGVDVITFTPNWKVVNKLMLESLLRKGDFCWHCHTGIYAYPMQVAIKEKVPLIIWGEKSSEYVAYYSYKSGKEEEEVDEERFNRMINLGITAEDMKFMLKDKELDPRDLNPYTYPNLEELKKIDYRSVCLGSYIPWDVKKQVEIIKKELDWKPDLNAGIPEEYSYEKVECQMQGVRDYARYLKRGYGRTAHLVALDIRNNRMKQNQARDLIEKYDGKRPQGLDFFLSGLNLDENEFNKIIKKHSIGDTQIEPKNLERGKKLEDRDLWLDNEKLERSYTLDKLKDFDII